MPWLTQKRLAGAVTMVVLWSLQTCHGDSPATMPDWPIGNTTYSVPAPRYTPATPPPTASATSRDGSLEPGVDPTSTASLDTTSQDAAVQAAHHEKVTSSGAEKAPPTELPATEAPDRSRGNELPSQSSSHDQRTIPKFGIPTGTIYTTATALTIVVGLFLLCMALLRRGSRGVAKMLPPEAVRVVGRVQVAPRQNAELLKVGNKLVLVALTPNGAEPLTEVTDPGEVNHILGLCQQFDKHSTTQAFEDVFRELAKDPGPEITFGGQSSYGPSTAAQAYRAHRHEASRA